jgi:hypothetical protein
MAHDYSLSQLSNNPTLRGLRHGSVNGVPSGKISSEKVGMMNAFLNLLFQFGRK